VLQAARLGLTDAIAAWRPGGAPFRVFARTCARRDAITAIDKARAAQRRVLADAIPLEDLALAGREPTSDAYAPTFGCDPLRTVLAREQLDAAIAVLPSLGRREAACLKGQLNGCSYTELARSLGGTRKTVESSVRRARRKIAIALERA
jgi:RNA polymerase sigma factor (sigma-70 family)